MALRQIQNHHASTAMAASLKPEQATRERRQVAQTKKPTASVLTRQTLNSVSSRQHNTTAMQGAKRQTQTSLAMKTSLDPSKRPIAASTRTATNKHSTKTTTNPSITTKAVSSNQPQKNSHPPTTDMVQDATKEVKGHVGRQRTLTPEPMDVAEVTGSFQRKLQLVEDIDEGDDENAQLCSEYVIDIYRHLQQLEAQYRVDPGYMERQAKINHRMRAVLIDWLVLVQIKFNLLQETLFLTISIIDKFLEVYPTPKEQLQLVGVTAMLIASKYEEIYYPQLSDFVYITDNTYNDEEVREMERIILRALDYNLAMPSPINFLRRYSKAAKVTSKLHTMAKFLLEASQLDFTMLYYLPSQVAASSLYIAMATSGEYKNEIWTPTLQFYSGYSKADLTPSIISLAKLILKMPSSKQQAVRDKYSNKKFLSIAKDPALQGDLIKSIANQEYI